jgi:hypothetical protein
MLAGGVAVVIVVFVLGAVITADVVMARWAGILALAASLGALIWTYADHTSDLIPMSASLAPTLVLSMVLQLWRRDGRPALTTSLTFVVTACVLAVLPVVWLALRASAEGSYAVGLALLGIGSLGLTETLPLSRGTRRVLGVLTGAVAAGALVMTVNRVGDAVPAVSAVVVTSFAGVMAGIAFAIVDRLVGELASPVPVTVPIADHPSASAGEGAAVSQLPVGGQTSPRINRAAKSFLPLHISLPFIVAAPAAYVLGRIFIS